jgi:hypothetical protein
MTRKSVLFLAACTLAGGTFAAQSTPPATNGSAQGTVIRTESVQTQSMQRLQQAADRLRESIQSLAQKQPGPGRDQALAEAHRALLRTQEAMVSLPPELRSSGSVSISGYDESVRKLMKSADSLRYAIQQMAQQPAGNRRDEAIRDANRALLDTQAAMALAYDPQGSTGSMGAPAASDTASHKAGGQPTQGGKVSLANPPSGAVLVLLPTDQAQGRSLADGCWVRFFDDRNFRGDALTLAGPVNLPRMDLGDAWRDWDSAVVGPKATVRTYDNENFHDRTAVLGAGQSIPDLRDRTLGWFQEVKSATVTCSS